MINKFLICSISNNSQNKNKLTEKKILVFGSQKWGVGGRKLEEGGQRLQLPVIR